MITMSTEIAVGQLAIFVTVSGAQLHFVWRAGQKLGEFGTVLGQLTKAVEGVGKLGERVLVLEVKEAAREKREKR